MDMLTGLAVAIVCIGGAAGLAIFVIGIAQTLARRWHSEPEERDDEDEDTDGGDWQPAWYGQNPATD